MHKASSLLFASTFVLGVLAACSDDSPAITTTQVPVDAGGDVGPVAVTPDATTPAACANVAGVYELANGSCTSTVAAPATVLCIRQRECALTGTNNFVGQVLTGTATNEQVTGATNGALTQTCTSTLANGTLGAFTCGAQGITCTGTAVRQVIPDATDYCCNAVTQDCAGGQRCQPRSLSVDVLAVSVCIPDRGTVELNGSCARASADVNAYGDDNCKKGLFCTNALQPNASARVCRKLCLTNADCTTPGDGCFQLGTIDAGQCIARCSLFDASGTNCPAGNTCRRDFSIVDGGLYNHDTRCSFTGAAAAGATCAVSTDCGAGLACNNAGKCAPHCDSAHPCATGLCRTFPGTYRPGPRSVDRRLRVT